MPTKLDQSRKIMRHMPSISLWLGTIFAVFASVEVFGTSRNFLTGSASTDEQVKREVQRIYVREAESKVEKVINHLTRAGFTCSAAQTKEDYDFWCDFKDPYILKTEHGELVVTFRRQILLGLRNDRLNLLVNSAIIAR